MGTTTKKKQATGGAANRRHVYITVPIWDALERICLTRNESISGVLQKKAKAYIRQHAPLLRKHNHDVPAEAFE